MPPMSSSPLPGRMTRSPRRSSGEGPRLALLVGIVMKGDADRPALGQRAVQFVKDAHTGRTSAELLPRLETITYRELWDRTGVVASAWTTKRVRPGDRVAVRCDCLSVSALPTRNPRHSRAESGVFVGRQVYRPWPPP
jgi:hypothetical protein